jgi:hypothetical protein
VVCPRCGGTDREPLAPGYWRCTSEVTVEQIIAAPDPAFGGEIRPRPVSSSETCGRDYQEASASVASMPQCTCGTFAVGTCSTCSAPVCGLHSDVFDGRRLCTFHFREAQAARERDREQERARQSQDRRAAIDAKAQAAAIDEHWCRAALSRLAELGHPGSVPLYKLGARRLSRPVDQGYRLGNHDWTDAREVRHRTQFVISSDGTVGTAYVDSGDRPWLRPLDPSTRAPSWTSIRAVLEVICSRAGITVA